MTDPATTPPPADDRRPAFPPPPGGEGAPAVVYRTQLPRAGELSPGWRVGTALTWIAVIVALAAVWNASVQLGLSTWWLGPRSQPRPLAIRLSPFAAPVLMILGALNHTRWLGWFGLAAAGAVVGVGVGDIGRVTSIATTEILIGIGGAAVSLASLTGTYRADPAAASRPATDSSPS